MIHSSCSLTARGGCTHRAVCSTGRAGALRAARVAAAQRHVHAAIKSHTRGVSAQGESHQPVVPRTWIRGVPLRGHYVPAGRAPHSRRDEPLIAISRGAAAGFFCVFSPQLAADGASSIEAGRRLSLRARRSKPCPGHRRFIPLTVRGRVIHQVGLPYHWGVGGGGAIVRGNSANDMLGVALDANVLIQEFESGLL